jgi:AraC-like DNA-binding protein
MAAIREIKTITGRQGPRRQHEHDEHSLTLLWRGSTEAQVGDSVFEARAGQIVLIAAGVPHKCSPRSSDDWSYTLMLLSVGSIPVLDEALAGATNGALVLDVKPELWKTLESASLADLDEILLGVVSHKVGRRSECARKRKPDPQLDIAESFLRTSLAEGASMDELAFAAGMSKYRLAREFKSAYGLSPHAYLLNLRINRAKAMLKSGTSPVETALACGFCDQSHLNHVFGSIVGIPPAAYTRSSAQEGARIYKTRHSEA